MSRGCRWPKISAEEADNRSRVSLPSVSVTQAPDHVEMTTERG